MRHFRILLPFISIWSASSTDPEIEPHDNRELTPKPVGISASQYSQVVVLPDVHGDLDALLHSLLLALRRIDVVDISFQAFAEPFYNLIYAVIGTLSRQDTFDLSELYPKPAMSPRQDVVIVQLGDLVDRGPYSVECIFAMAVIPAIIGWKTVQLYGNHELWNLEQYFEYVHHRDGDLFELLSPNNAASFRQEAFTSPNGMIYKHLISQFLGLGVLHASPSTQYKDRSEDPRTLFLHGGIDLEWLGDVAPNAQSFDEINTKVTDLIRRSAEGELTHIDEPVSILWNRVLAQAPEPEVCTTADLILQHFQVARIVIGHTPQDDMKVKTRCKGAIILADVRMSRWMISDFHEGELSSGQPIAIIMTIDPSNEQLQSIDVHYGDIETESITSVKL
jgi:hypothetical protein